jgi:hypothetical protein
MTLKTLSTIAFALVMAGCSAMLVPSTDDPKEKLAWADALIEDQNRPIPAEKLIREAIQIYKDKNDVEGLANGYRRYGVFYRSAAVTRMESYYRTTGFLEKGVTFDQRFDKAIEYLTLSRNLFSAQNSYSDLSNVDINLAWSYESKGIKKDACLALSASLGNHEKFSKSDPTRKVYLIKGYSSFSDLIDKERKRLGCL